MRCVLDARRSSIRLHAEDADGATHFLMKTLPKVATEMALHVLAYNLTRVMNLLVSNRSSRRSGREECVLLCAPCDRSGRSAWFRDCARIDSKLDSKNMLRRSRRRGSRPVACSFWGEENVFTRPDPYRKSCCWPCEHAMV